MAFNYDKLRGRIVEKFGNNKNFADAMGWSERTLSLKLSNQRFWKQKEILMAIEKLGLTVNDILTYFFTEKVQDN